MRIITSFDSDDSYYLIAPEDVKMDKILNAIFNNTGMRKKSFAEQEVQWIFSCLFQNAEDLGHYYKTYYFEEYDSFPDFLYQYKLFEEDFIDHISLRENETLWELRYHIDSYQVRQILGHENENLPLFNRFLEGIRL